MQIYLWLGQKGCCGEFGNGLLVIGTWDDCLAEIQYLFVVLGTEKVERW